MPGASYQDHIEIAIWNSWTGPAVYSRGWIHFQQSILKHVNSPCKLGVGGQESG